MFRNAEQFESELLTTEAQLDLLRDYNERYWGGELAESQFQATPVDDQPQTLDNVHVLHAEFANPIDTIDHWRKVYMNAHWGRGEVHWNSLPPTKYLGEQLRLLDPAKGPIATYTPGIHLVRMDLTKDNASFDGRDEHGTFRQVRDLDEVRKEVDRTSMLLAHSEVLSVVGLHKAFQANGGYASEHGPYLSGYEMKNIFVGRPGPEYDWVPVMGSSGREDQMGLRCRPAKGNLFGAIPLVHPRA